MHPLGNITWTFCVLYYKYDIRNDRLPVHSSVLWYMLNRNVYFIDLVAEKQGKRKGAVNKLRIKDMGQIMSSSEYYLCTCLQFTFLICYERAKFLEKQGKFARAMLSACAARLLLVLSRSI